MKKTVRYCINCGKEIGSLQFCDTPDCEGIPNFYRDIRGPQNTAHRPEAGAGNAGEGMQEAMAVSTPVVAPGTDTATDLAPEPGKRRATMPLSGKPVAVLRGATPPQTEHLTVFFMVLHLFG